MKTLLKLLSALSLLTLASVGYAYDCSGLPGYVMGSAYADGAKVKNVGAAFSCKVSGWCSLNSDAYAPGTGWAYKDAWNDLGSCDGSTGSSSSTSSSTSSSSSSVSSSVSSSSSSSSSTTTGGTCPTWTAGVNYYTGDVVLYPANGNHYIAEHDNPGYDPTVSTWFWDPVSGCPGGGGTSSSSSSSSGGSGGFSSILSQQQFDQMFPSRDPFFTYQGLLDAVAHYTAFGGTGSTTVRKQEVAAAMANFHHETGGLVYREEIAKAEYCSGTSTPCGVCAPGKWYYGRGPIQLSWNFNYCLAGLDFGINLWANPELVATDPAISWKSAIWYWMTQNGPGTMTSHAAMVNSVGFGETIRSINGALECNGGYPDKVQSRINKYTEFTQILGVPTGSNLGC